MKEMTLQTNSVRKVTHQSSGMYMFQPHAGRQPISKLEQKRDIAFKKSLKEARKRHGVTEKPGGNAA